MSSRTPSRSKSPTFQRTRMILLSMALVAAVSAPSTLHTYEGLALSPDGTRIVAIESDKPVEETADDHATIVIRDTQGVVLATIDPCEKCRYFGATWSPDGKRLAFVGTASGKATLFTVDDGNVKPLSEIAGDTGALRWSPDGRMLSLLVTLDAKKEAGATQPGVRLVGEIDEDNDSRRIATFDATDGTMHLISSDKTFVYEYDWLPDGKGFVATAAEGNGDNNWWIATLRRFDLDGSTKVIAKPIDQINLPRVSPDGRSVAYIGGRMSDFGSIGGDVFVVPLDGGKPLDVTPAVKASFTSIHWQGPIIHGTVVVGGSVGATSVDPVSRRMSPITMHAGSVSSSQGAIDSGRSGRSPSSDASGRIVAFAVEAFDSPSHIEYGPLGATKAITHDNDALVAKASARSVSWKNEGLTVQGWLLTPKGDDKPTSLHPMVTIVHGGPSAVVTPRYVWERTAEDLLALGYYVFLPNPRGSFGNGVAFANANYRAFGRADFRDILKGIDAVEKVAPVDEKRLGIYGHSYGGFMAMWAVTHTSRFKAAVAGAGVANWVSYYGQNGIDQWMTPFFGKTLYDDPKIYDDLSPIRTIKTATTPTLIYVGERDIEVPAVQSEEFWRGLKAVGVPTTLVIYEGEGHRIRKADHVNDLDKRVTDWFVRYLGK
jgi:dipeptidyl aminopeptidase/acylaminoacyl peptidase